MTQVGQDIYGDQVKGRFGENVSISGDGSRVAIGNRHSISMMLEFHTSTGVDTKFYVYEYDHKLRIHKGLFSKFNDR